jgi:2-deoxy-D-gluconate 3-dehydrogenase
MCYGLAEAGADIVGIYHTHSPGEIQRRLRELGRRFMGIKADLSSLEPIEGIVKKTVENFERLDILVNNAGMLRRADAIGYTEQDWDEVINLNLKTVFFLSQAVAREMIKMGGGKIINVASMTSFQGGAFIPSYAASKAGIAAITRSLAIEWAQDGINVNAIAPGWMATDMTKGLRMDQARSKNLMDRIPAGRWGLGEDLMGAVVFLASDASSYIYGHVLCVDGGYLAK